MVFNAEVPGENQRPAASHWLTLSHNVVSEIQKTRDTFIVHLKSCIFDSSRTTSDHIVYALQRRNCCPYCFKSCIFRTEHILLHLRTIQKLRRGGVTTFDYYWKYKENLGRDKTFSIFLQGTYSFLQE